MNGQKKKTNSKMYQVGLDGGADSQLVPFLLDFLDEVNEHVCLKQVLQDKKQQQKNPTHFILFLLMMRENLIIKTFSIIQWLKLEMLLSFKDMNHFLFRQVSN